MNVLSFKAHIVAFLIFFCLFKKKSLLENVVVKSVVLPRVSWDEGEYRLSKMLPSYRSPAVIRINKSFLLKSKNK